MFESMVSMVVEPSNPPSDQAAHRALFILQPCLFYPRAHVRPPGAPDPPHRPGSAVGLPGTSGAGTQVGGAGPGRSAALGGPWGRWRRPWRAHVGAGPRTRTQTRTVVTGAGTGRALLLLKHRRPLLCAVSDLGGLSSLPRPSPPVGPWPFIPPLRTLGRGPAPGRGAQAPARPPAGAASQRCVLWVAFPRCLVLWLLLPVLRWPLGFSLSARGVRTAAPKFLGPTKTAFAALFLGRGGKDCAELHEFRVCARPGCASLLRKRLGRSRSSDWPLSLVPFCPGSRLLARCDRSLILSCNWMSFFLYFGRTQACARLELWLAFLL